MTDQSDELAIKCQDTFLCNKQFTNNCCTVDNISERQGVQGRQDCSMPLSCDPNLMETKVSKILIVYDADTPAYEEMVQFVTEQGYHPITLLVNDSMFSSNSEFINMFQKITRMRSDFVFGIVFYSSDKTDMCMFCCQQQVASARLLKLAFGSMYVEWGRTRCALVHPVHCCSNDVTLPPLSQLSEMSFPYSFSPDCSVVMLYNDIWIALQQKIVAIQVSDNRKGETRHILIQDLIEEKNMPLLALPPASPMTLEQLLDRINADFVGPNRKQFAMEMGVSSMDWDELMNRMPDQALFFVLRKLYYSATRNNTINGDATKGVLTKIADALRKHGQSSTLVDVVVAFAEPSGAFAEPTNIKNETKTEEPKKHRHTYQYINDKGKEEEVSYSDSDSDANIEVADANSAEEEEGFKGKSVPLTVTKRGRREGGKIHNAVPFNEDVCEERYEIRKSAMNPTSVATVAPQSIAFLPPSLRAKFEAMDSITAPTTTTTITKNARIKDAGIKDKAVTKDGGVSIIDDFDMELKKRDREVLDMLIQREEATKTWGLMPSGLQDSSVVLGCQDGSRLGTTTNLETKTRPDRHNDMLGGFAGKSQEPRGYRTNDAI